MTDKAVASLGAKLEINTTGTTWVEVKGLKSFSGIGSGSAAVIDVSDLASTGKEKMLGLLDEGQMGNEFHFIAKDAGQLAVRAARGARELKKYRYTLSDTTKYEFSAYALTFERSVDGVDGVVSASVTFEVSGLVAETPPAV